MSCSNRVSGTQNSEIYFPEKMDYSIAYLAISIIAGASGFLLGLTISFDVMGSLGSVSVFMGICAWHEHRTKANLSNIVLKKTPELQQMPEIPRPQQLLLSPAPISPIGSQATSTFGEKKMSSMSKGIPEGSVTSSNSTLRIEKTRGSSFVDGVVKGAPSSAEDLTEDNIHSDSDSESDNESLLGTAKRVQFTLPREKTGSGFSNKDMLSSGREFLTEDNIHSDSESESENESRHAIGSPMATPKRKLQFTPPPSQELARASSPQLVSIYSPKHEVRNGVKQGSISIPTSDMAPNVIPNVTPGIVSNAIVNLSNSSESVPQSVNIGLRQRVDFPSISMVQKDPVPTIVMVPVVGHYPCKLNTQLRFESNMTLLQVEEAMRHKFPNMRPFMICDIKGRILSVAELNIQIKDREGEVEKRPNKIRPKQSSKVPPIDICSVPKWRELKAPVSKV